MANRRRPARLLMKKAPRKNRKKGMTVFNRITVNGLTVKVFAGIAVLLMVSVGFVSGYGYFVRSDCLRIKEIQVEGISILSREDVIKRAGIETGTNILEVNLSVAKRWLQGDPWIAEVRISRVLPSTIVIAIREHTPVAIMDWEGGLLINSRREVFKRVESTDPAALPVISGVDGEDLNATGRSASKVLNAALDVIETASVIGKRMPGMNIRKVIADRDTGLTLYAFDAVDAVRLGFDDDNDNYINKFRRLNHMLRHRVHQDGGGRLAAAGFEYPDRVVVKTAVGNSYAAIEKGGNHEGTGYHRRS